MKHMGKNYFLKFCAVFFLTGVFYTGHTQSLPVIEKTTGSKPVAWWNFNSCRSGIITDIVTDIKDSVRGNFSLVSGISGRALKLDGYTTRVIRKSGRVPGLGNSFTLEAWVAAATYPWNWCPIMSCERNKEAGYYFGIGPQGQAGVFASVNGIWQKCETKEKIPLKTWNWIVATFDKDVGLRIYVNGNLSGQLNVKGNLKQATASDLYIGMNREKTMPSNPVRVFATLPSWFSFDGIFDELKMYDVALSPKTIKKEFESFTIPSPPDLPKRVMPSGPEGPGRFGAYYTKLKYYDEWDALFRSGDYSDIVVEFDNSPIRVVFWRGTRYSPAWVMENGQWMSDQSAEYFDTINGCYEHMIDPHCLYSHVKIIENTPARVMVHWRYIPVCVRKYLSQVDEKTGWSDCVDEYYTFYPDGIGIRKVIQYTSGKPLGPSEAIVLCQPGTKPEDNVNLDAVTLVNLKGESHVYSWADGPPAFKKGENPANPVIQIINLKSQYKPFLIFEPENNMEVFGIEQRPDMSHFPWWNHWPVAQLPSDGRYCQAPDRASHFSLAWGRPPFHDEDGNIIIVKKAGSKSKLKQPQIKKKSFNTYWSSWMYGASKQTPKELAMLARSWVKPPVLNIKGNDFLNKGYDLSQRAYILECNKNKSDHLQMVLFADNESPVVNVCFVIKGWAPENISVQLDGHILEKKKDYESGIIRNLVKDNLVLWIKMRSVKPRKIIVTSNN